MSREVAKQVGLVADMLREAWSPVLDGHYLSWVQGLYSTVR